MSAYFLYQPSRSSMTLHPTVPNQKATSTHSKVSSDSSRSWERRPALSPSESQIALVHAAERRSQHQSKGKKVLSSLKKGWKEHHESVQAAFEAYYGIGLTGDKRYTY